MIRGQMDAAFAGADLIRPQDERLEAPNGVFLEVDLRPGTNPEKTLERPDSRVVWRVQKYRCGVCRNLPWAIDVSLWS